MTLKYINNGVVEVIGNFNYSYLFCIIKRRNKEELKFPNGIAHLSEHIFISKENKLLENIDACGVTNYEKIQLMFRYKSDPINYKNLIEHLYNIFHKHLIKQSFIDDAKNEVEKEINYYAMQNTGIKNKINIISEGHYRVLPLGTISSINSMNDKQIYDYLEKLCIFSEVLFIHVANEPSFDLHNFLQSSSSSQIGEKKPTFVQDNKESITVKMFKNEQILKKEIYFKMNRVRNNIESELMKELFCLWLNRQDLIKKKYRITAEIDYYEIYLDANHYYVRIQFDSLCNENELSYFSKHLQSIRTSNSLFDTLKKGLFNAMTIPEEVDLQSIIESLSQSFIFGDELILTENDVSKAKEILMNITLSNFQDYVKKISNNTQFVFA